MVSCLTLLGSTHARARSDAGTAQTLCGLVIAESDSTPAMFAQEASAATCTRCRDRLRIAAASTAQAARAPPAWDVGASVEHLIARLNANDSAGLASILGGRLLESLSAQRMDRLHQLFPAWCATADEVITDRSSAVLRYRVSFVDSCGLLGSQGPASRAGQCVIFRLANDRLVDAFPVVDDFAFWSSGDGPQAAACAHCECALRVRTPHPEEFRP